MSIFEITMLVCFGAAWPFSIHKSYVAKVNGSKSPIFLFIVLVGYGAGILHKLYFNFNPVIWLYALNGIMVAIDIGIYYRNIKLERKVK